MKNKKLMYIILIVLIIATSAGGTAFLVVNNNKIKGFEKTDAIVVDYREKMEYDSEYGYREMYAEIVEYKVNDVKYRAQNNVWTNAPKSIGKTIEIAYDPNSPSTCVFVKSNNFAALVLYIMCAIITLALVMQIFVDRKRAKEDFKGYL